MKYIIASLSVFLLCACASKASDNIYVYEDNVYIGRVQILQDIGIRFSPNKRALQKTCTKYLQALEEEIAEKGGFLMRGPSIGIFDKLTTERPDFIPLNEGDDVLYEYIPFVSAKESIFRKAILGDLTFSSCSVLTEREHLLHQK